MKFLTSTTLVAALAISAACSSTTATAPAGATSNSLTDPQKPPTSGNDVQTWLKNGYYKAWKCEPAVHEARKPSPHGKNRICSNDATSTHGSGEFPVDAAGVKEIFDEAGTTIVGYAVYRHVTAGAGGDSWYWYETVPAASKAPHDANNVVADGLGSGGPAKDICVGCHVGAGSDANHSGHDFVYTQVK